MPGCPAHRDEGVYADIEQKKINNSEEVEDEGESRKGHLCLSFWKKYRTTPNEKVPGKGTRLSVRQSTKNRTVV